jgi:ABC-type molybdate transport system permease subunit
MKLIKALILSVAIVGLAFPSGNVSTTAKASPLIIPPAPNQGSGGGCTLTIIWGPYGPIGYYWSC